MVDFIQVHSASTCTHTNYTCHIIVKHNIDLATYTLSTDAHSAGTHKTCRHRILHIAPIVHVHIALVYIVVVCAPSILCMCSTGTTRSYHLLTARKHIAHAYI